MKVAFDPMQLHRQSHRLRGYDYSLSAPYFVTLCTQNYLCLFGEVKDEKMFLSEQGRMVEIRTNPLKWLLDRENPDVTGANDFDEWLLAVE